MSDSIDKHPAFIVRQASPFNGGPPLPELVADPVTPVGLFFVRNHAPTPRIDGDSFRLRVAGHVGRSLELGVDDLRRKFRYREVAATLQCAGNRRDELIAHRDVPGEVPWGAEAIGNARWGGVSLAAVLDAAGIGERARHVAFVGADKIEKEGQTIGFGGSIPIAKARDENVLLAYEMNGDALPPTHGFPLRVVVPGYIGARSVKWVNEVRVQERPSDNYFQQRSYKLFPPEVSANTVDWSSGQMLGEIGPTAVVCDRVRDGDAWILRGYAMGSGGAEVSAVDVSPDGGSSWQRAEIEFGTVGTWYLWRVLLEAPDPTREIVVRIEDGGGGVQANDVAEVWNFKGYMNTAMYRTRIG